MGAKTPTPQDVYIGERIREARYASNMSQRALAELIGVSYQQMQKYESGVNRVNGGRIGLLVTALNRPLTYFFPNATDVRMRADPLLSSVMATREGHEVVVGFSRLAAPPDRRLVLDLIKRLAKET